MVAFGSLQEIRDILTNSPLASQREVFPLTPLPQPPEPSGSTPDPRGDGAGFRVSRNEDKEIANVRVGRWRSVSSSPDRRIVEVRRLACERVALKLEVNANNGSRSSVVWQLYNQQGRLLATMQLTADGGNALLSSYETRHVCRLVRDEQGELQNVEQWRM